MASSSCPLSPLPLPAPVPAAVVAVCGVRGRPKSKSNVGVREDSTGGDLVPCICGVGCGEHRHGPYVEQSKYLPSLFPHVVHTCMRVVSYIRDPPSSLSYFPTSFSSSSSTSSSSCESTVFVLIDTRLFPLSLPFTGVLDDVLELSPRCGLFAGLFEARDGVLVFAVGVLSLGVPPRPLLDMAAS